MAADPPSLLYATIFDRSGYAAAARRYLRALTEVHHPVALFGMRHTGFGVHPTDDLTSAPEEMRQLPTTAADDATVLVHCIPHSWHRVAERFPDRRLIGQTVWEADQLPTRWRTELACVGEIWVPTQWNADTFRASGITVPLHVVPHAVDTTEPRPPKFELDGSPFMFLNIGTWDWRKRPDLLLHAYLKAFTATDDVVLVLKTDLKVLSWDTTSDVEKNTWWQVMDVVRRYRNPAAVVLVTDAWSDANMAWISATADCYVSLTCTEGWGLGAFDAAAAGTPLIMTGHGGQMEWMGTDHPGAVPFEMVTASHPNGMFEHGTEWAIADVDAAADMMRSVYAGGSEITAAAGPLATRLHERYSLRAVGETMVEALR